jgi:hypothetical protein
VGLYAGLIANLLRTAPAPAPVPGAIRLPIAVNDYAMDQLTAWLNANTAPNVVTGFDRDLVRGLIQDLAPRILSQPWHTRAL